MPKVKIPRKSTSLDMTPMCDMAFLLLTFFILTAQFKADEAVVVDTPSSVAEIPVPETNLMTIIIDKEDKVYFGVEGQFTRDKMVRDMAGKYQIGITEAQIKQFSLLPSFGVPIAQLPQYLSLKSDQRKKFKSPGIPLDSLDNQLRDWVAFARYANPNPMRIAIRGDQFAKTEAVKKVISTLQDQNINKFNLVTNMEERPALN